MKNEKKENEQETQDLSPLAKLILGFLPLDVEALIAFCETIYEEAQATSWDSVFRRIATFSITLTAISVFVLGALFIVLDYNFSEAEFGFQIFLGGAMLLLGLLTFTKWFIKQMQNINEGKSPVAPEIENRWGIFIEIALGMIFLIVLIVVSIKSLDPIGILAVSTIGGALMGMAIAGIALIFSGFFRVVEIYRPEEENKTLDDYFTDD